MGQKILFCEDDARAAELASFFTARKYEVTLVDNLCEAEYCLEDDPGADFFDLLFLDLSMPIKDLPKELHAECLEGSRHYSGWVFYKHIVSKHPKLYEKTVFYTGFANQLREKIGKMEFENLRVIDKSSRTLTKDVTIILREYDLTR